MPTAKMSAVNGTINALLATNARADTT